MPPPLDMGKTSGFWMVCSLAEVDPTASDTLVCKKMGGKKWGTLTSAFCHKSFASLLRSQCFDLRAGVHPIQSGVPVA
jgi:hypothetical protein